MTASPFSKSAKCGKFLCAVLLLLCALCGAFGCKTAVDYTEYISELRSNIFLAQSEEFSLRIYAVKKESPYVADGVCEEVSPRMEVYLLAPEGAQTVTLSLLLDGNEVGGELSYDNVKGEYFFSRTLELSGYSTLPCTLRYGEKEVKLTATSVLTERTLPAEVVLKNVRENAPELFSSLTDKYGFAGEIYIRLLYEDAPYYYVGVLDRTGKAYAFLLSGETGKLLAKRESDG